MENWKAQIEAEVKSRIGWHPELPPVPTKPRVKSTRRFLPRRRMGRPRAPGAAFKRTFVYFLLSEAGLVKIGVTSNLIRRLRRIVDEVDCRFSVVTFTPGDYMTEQTLHSHFKRHWVKGEWFRSDPEIMSFAEQLREIEAVTAPAAI